MSEQPATHERQEGRFESLCGLDVANLANFPLLFSSILTLLCHDRVWKVSRPYSK